MTLCSSDTRIAYLTQFYTNAQIDQFCNGSEARLDELYRDTQPQEVCITELSDVNDGALYLCDSPDGWVPVEQWRNKGTKPVQRVVLDNGEMVVASDDHLFQRITGEWAYNRDLKTGDFLITKDGASPIASLMPLGDMVVYDLAIGHENHRYFTNDISSHNSGKSLFLLNLAFNWAHLGLDVVYFSLELSEDLVAERGEAIISGFPTSEFFSNIDEVAGIIEKRGKLTGKVHIKKVSQAGTTTNDLRAYLKEYEIKFGKKPDAVLIDYLDLMHPNNRRIDPSDLFVKDKYVSEEVRGLMHEMNCYGATASQLNRGSIETSEFDHSHIAGGISKINTSDNTFGIFAPQSLKDKGIIELQMLKIRSAGSVGQTLKLSYNPQTMLISDMDENAKMTQKATAETIRKQAKVALKDDIKDAKAGFDRSRLDRLMGRGSGDAAPPS